MSGDCTGRGESQTYLQRGELAPVQPRPALSAPCSASACSASSHPSANLPPPVLPLSRRPCCWGPQDTQHQRCLWANQPQRPQQPRATLASHHISIPSSSSPFECCFTQCFAARHAHRRRSCSKAYDAHSASEQQQLHRTTRRSPPVLQPSRSSHAAASVWQRPRWLRTHHSIHEPWTFAAAFACAGLCCRLQAPGCEIIPSCRGCCAFALVASLVKPPRGLLFSSERTPRHHAYENVQRFTTTSDLQILVHEASGAYIRLAYRLYPNLTTSCPVYPMAWKRW